MKTQIPWYLSAWFIVMITGLLGLINPILLLFPGVILIPLLIFFHSKKVKNAMKKASVLDGLEKKGYGESIELETLIASQKNEIEKNNDELKNTKTQINTIKSQHENLSKEYIELEDEILLQSFGFYDPKYNLQDSTAYKIRLANIRDKQKEMVKSKTAADFSSNWTVNGSKAEGKKMTNNTIKLAIRSFNNECDVAISKVTISNVESMENRIKKTFETINKLNVSNAVQLRVEYLKLKYEELHLALEYAQKIEKEKEEQREIREQMREEEQSRREIAKLKEKVEKEEQHFIQAIGNLENQKAAADEKQLEKLELKLIELRDKLAEVTSQKEDVMNRERNTRAGYVYVISNIGSFGENVYKIGMTRRLEPLDRVRELGSASVPFLFDVHAMIFSEDAPKLENVLHRTFENNRLNLVNERKEFFKVSLDEIQSVVEKNHDKTIEFKTTAVAEDYRQTLAIRKKITEKELVTA